MLEKSFSQLISLVGEGQFTQLFLVDFVWMSVELEFEHLLAFLSPRDKYCISPICRQRGDSFGSSPVRNEGFFVVLTSPIFGGLLSLLNSL